MVYCGCVLYTAGVAINNHFLGKLCSSRCMASICLVCSTSPVPKTPGNIIIYITFYGYSEN